MEDKNKMRIQRKNASEKRIQAAKDLLHNIIERPINIICRMTIPVSEKAKWHRGFASVNPTCSLITILIPADSKCPGLNR